MHELALFAGAGGGILGGRLLGWRTVCAVELDPYARQVLLARQRDGQLHRFPIWDDVTTFDGNPWRGHVDIITGGFPCQDISSAGKGAGIQGSRSGLWREMSRIIREVRPRFAFVENSPMLTTRGLDVVLGDLASMGYHARWGVLGARHVGAPHKRDRIWIAAKLGDTDGKGLERQPRHELRKQERAQTLGSAAEAGVLPRASNAADTGCRRYRAPDKEIRTGRTGAVHGDWWEAEPELGRVAHGVACRVDRLRALGNGQVPAVAALAWRILTTGWDDEQ